MNVFINLCVADVARSRAFFGALGFSFNDYFSNEDTLAMRLSDTSFVMMMHTDKFAGFTPRAIADATQTSEVLTALQLDSRAEVDKMTDAAIANGGSAFRPPEDHGFMYGRSFCDPDGHVWEPFYYDASTIPEEHR